jgi:acetylornithine deacetylase
MDDAPTLDPRDTRPDARLMLDGLEHLCADDTTTGHEDRGLGALRELLEDAGADVETFEVERGRHNVLATWSGAPRLLLSTHLDTVPPYLPPRRNGDVLAGRGACDAKGQIVAQLAAVRALLAAGHTDLAWLGVVGEETDSIGAERALLLAPRLRSLRAAIDGEPTRNVLATGQRGSLQLRLRARGIAAHSGTPERGRSAIWSLLEWLERLREVPQARDEELGPELWNLGRIQGGEAPNVVPAGAEAVLFVRSLPGSRFLEDVRGLAPADAEVEVVAQTEPERFPHVPGFPHAPVPFGSDAPRLRRLVPSGAVALVGPGDIELAHSPEELFTGAELEAGRALLVHLGTRLLAPVREDERDPA